MNRTFHARITGYQYLYLLLLGLLTFFLLWNKSIIPATICAILLILSIERFIHTAYTITPDGQLILSTGRFGKPQTIRIEDIVSITKRSSVKIAGYAVLHYVLIEYGSGQYASVSPVKEQEFIGVLKERRKTTGNNLTK